MTLSPPADFLCQDENPEILDVAMQQDLKTEIATWETENAGENCDETVPSSLTALEKSRGHVGGFG